VNDILWSGSVASYFSQGTITFLTGANAGLTRTIKVSSATALTLTLPLPHAPGTGDTFHAYPGCDKTLATCKSRFSNTVNNRSFPYVPVPQVAL
jgi:uncharacterized phage protein (TIGR02218 family)